LGLSSSSDEEEDGFSPSSMPTSAASIPSEAQRSQFISNLSPDVPARTRSTEHRQGRASVTGHELLTKELPQPFDPAERGRLLRRRREHQVARVVQPLHLAQRHDGTRKRHGHSKAGGNVGLEEFGGYADIDIYIEGVGTDVVRRGWLIPPRPVFTIYRVSKPWASPTSRALAFSRVLLPSPVSSATGTRPVPGFLLFSGIAAARSAGSASATN
jgi:hypothetical protein